MQYPLMHRIAQTFQADSIADIDGEVRNRLAPIAIPAAAGAPVAVAVGSRGIHHIRRIVAAVVNCLKDRGYEPFIMPAMGSHGGATAEGQRRLLAELGICQDTTGAPIVSSMDTVSLGRLDSGCDVLFARDAMEAGAVFVINRVKPHTAFRGPVESGLCKMLVVGCGKHRGAENIHTYDVAAALEPAARLILAQAPILGGLAVLENARGGVQAMELAAPENFIEIDRRLLRQARRLLPSLPVDALDLLIVDEIGKNISGSGMDPNVIGFWRRDGGERQPDYRCIVVLDLTAASHGNALGIGWADLTTRRLVNKMDVKVSYTNAITAGAFRAVRLPLTLESDREAVDTALLKVPNVLGARIARIRNTLELETFWASSALVEELARDAAISVSGHTAAFAFDAAGRLQPFEN